MFGNSSAVPDLRDGNASFRDALVIFFAMVNFAQTGPTRVGTVQTAFR